MKSITVHYSKSEGWIAVSTYSVPPTALSPIVPVSVELLIYSDAALAHFIVCAAKEQNTYSIFECRRIDCSMRSMYDAANPKEQGETAHTD